VLIAVAVLGFMVASIPPAMMVVSNAQFRQYEHRIAQNLTRNQFEYIKAQDYNPGIPPGKLTSQQYGRVPVPSAYLMQVAYSWMDPSTHEPIGNETDTGVQQVTITVFGWRGDPDNEYTRIMETTDYKIDRSLQISRWEVGG
jgi:hypothetical protein